MKTRAPIIGTLIVAIATLPACRVRQRDCMVDHELSHYVQAATDIEYPHERECETPERMFTPAPFRISDYEQAEFWDLSLQEAVQLALANSPVLRDLGGTVLRAPGTIRTTFDPSVIETDPRFGVEAALSAFDTDFQTRIFAEQNDRRLNNQFLGNLGFLQQNFGFLETQLQKRAATGSQFILRKNVEFDKNSSLGNEFDDGWTVIVEGELRQPLLQGAGLPFNRIAGPDGGPGAINGVLIARIRTDISLAEFELAVRNLVSNVENTYWDVYYAYRDLDAKIAARDAALETWRRISALAATGRRGGEAEKEAQAREQYFQFKLEVENALTGRLLEGTRTNNGSGGGTFRGSPGVYVNERRLRLAMGLPINDGRLIRPAEEPPTAPVLFDWSYSSGEALFRRSELRRQKWDVKRREMELTASRNLLLPNLDVVGRYRFRGFGDSLINSYRNAGKDPDFEFDNAYQSLTSGEFQEWQLGFEFSMPLGFRQAHTAVRNAELQLARSRAVLREQEHQVLHDLSDAISDVDRSYTVMETSYNRLRAAKDQLDAVEAAFLADKVEFFVVLDSQRRLADTASQYYQSQVEYALSLRNVHFEKGSLLDYCGVRLSEGPWPQEAFVDAANREHRRGRPHRVRSTRRNPPIVSDGSYPQESLHDPYGEPAMNFDPYADPYEPVPSVPADQAPLPPPQSSSPNNIPQLDAEPEIAPYAGLAGKLKRLVANPAVPPSIQSPRTLTSGGSEALLPSQAAPPREAAPPAPPDWLTAQATRASRPRAEDPWNVALRTQVDPGERGAEVPHAADDGWIRPGARRVVPDSSAGQPWEPRYDQVDVRFPPNAGNAVRGAMPSEPWNASLMPQRPPAGGQSFPATTTDDTRQPRTPNVSQLVAPDNLSHRATPAGKWVIAEQAAGERAEATSGVTPPLSPASVRLLPERRAERFAHPSPADTQVRLVPPESTRRLPPVPTAGPGSRPLW